MQDRLLYLYQKETPVQVFSCEFYKILKNTYFVEHLRTAASGKSYLCKCLSYGTFRKWLPGEKVFTLDFAKQEEKLRVSMKFLKL